MNALALRTLLPLALSTSVQAQDGADWPQWRGPERTGVSVEAAWGVEAAAEPLWTKELGLGHSSFAVAHGRVYTLGYDAEAGLDTVFCLDAETGEELWTHRYASEIWDVAHDGGALTTPTVSEGDVFTSNREGKVFCFDAETGEVRWQRDLRADFELEPPTWGFSASPLLVGDMIVMNVDRIIALNRRTGEDVWVTDQGYGIAYSTPAFFELDGEQYLASLSGDGLLVLDPWDGAPIDMYEWVKEPQIYPMTPVVIGDRIFISAGYDRGCAMLSFDGKALSELWASRVMRNKMSGCVLYEDHLFGFDESILKCIDLDGNERWRQRGLGTGSMTIAGGRMVILDGKGQVIVAEADPQAYTELSRVDVMDDGTSWSSPVLSHGRVYCRSSKGRMVCLDFRGAPVEASSPLAMPLEGGDVPSAEAIVARHTAAVGGAGALEGVAALRMSGASESLLNTVRKGKVELDWVPGTGFAWRDDTGFELVANTDLGWTAGARSAPELLDGEALAAAREAGDLTRIFDPAGFYASLGEVTRTTFDNRDCYAVAAQTREGYARTLYFELGSGLYAGHDGDGIPMWTVGAYAQHGGVTLPTHWTSYEPRNGELNSARFDVVSVDAEPDPTRFDPPELIRLLLRTPEEIAAANEVLLEKHAALLGDWQATDGPAGAPGMSFAVEEGFLVLRRGEREPDRLDVDEETGGLFMLAAPYVTFALEEDEDGALESIQIHVGDEPRTRLVRGE